MDKQSIRFLPIPSTILVLLDPGRKVLSCIYYVEHITLFARVDVVDKPSNVHVTGEFRRVNFYVKVLFTNVPVDCLLLFLPVEKDVLLQLIMLCKSDCKFGFQEEHYEQTFVVVMGNPLFPVLSNLYVEFFERRLFCSNFHCNAV